MTILYQAIENTLYNGQQNQCDIGEAHDGKDAIE